MNKQAIKEMLKNLLGIIVVIYFMRVGSQFLYEPGVIGISFGYLNDDYPQISIIEKDSPLKETNISINDAIIKVDDEDIKNKSISYIIKKIRGKVNTDVKLLIKHEDSIKEYTITRVKRKIDWFPFQEIKLVGRI